MELPVALQLREFGWALLFGAGAGLAQDLLRPLRRGRVSTALADALYCLLLLLGLLLFALYAGRGRLRIFALAAMALSGGLWLRLVSPIFRRLETARRRLFQRSCRALKKSLKSMKFFSKNEKN